MLSIGYDAHGNRTSLTAKIGVTSLGTTTGYDAANRPDRITDPLARSFGITYDANGNRAQITYPNNTTTAYAYDPLNRLTSLAATETPASGPPTTVTSFAYSLDTAGRRTQLSEGDGAVRQYTYDGVDRLTGEVVTGALSYAKTFAYDPVGNRLTQTTTGAGAGTVNYAYDRRDRLTTENATTYSYDTDGNMTSKSGEATYTWDFENRLTNVAMTVGTTVAHQYDADGNRVQTTVTPTAGTATTTNMLVDTVGCASCGGGLSRVIADTDANGATTALYVRAGDELLEVMRPGAAPGTWSTGFIHSDGLGSVRALTDESGTTVDTRGYEAFGTKNVEAGSDPLTYGFAGEPFESTSMLAYHRARWMGARVGRFEGMDPLDGDIKYPAKLHRYVYASNDPTDMVDPSGKLDAEPNYFNSIEAVWTAITRGDASIVLRAHPVEWGLFSILADHLYLLYTDPKGARTVYEGGPEFFPEDKISGNWGRLGMGKGDWDNDTKLRQSHPNDDASSLPLATGLSAVVGKQCLERAIGTVTSMNAHYHPWGPNSNTAAVAVCAICRLPLMLPTSFAWGWNTTLTPGN